MRVATGVASMSVKFRLLLGVLLVQFSGRANCLSLILSSTTLSSKTLASFALAPQPLLSSTTRIRAAAAKINAIATTSSSRIKDDEEEISKKPSLSLSRRTVLHRRCDAAVLTLSVATTALLLGSLLLLSLTLPSPAFAACMAGDISKECIGVYKIPTSSSSTTTTTASSFDAKAVDAALQVLRAQRLALEDVKEVVTAGRFEEAGIKVLNMVPRVTSAGRVVVSSLNSSSSQGVGGTPVDQLRLSMAQAKWQELLGLLGQCDFSIGQGLRNSGSFGSVTVAQLSILSELDEAAIAFDDFLALVLQTTAR